LCVGIWTTPSWAKDGSLCVSKGPKGQKRPADVIGNAVKVMRIATGEETDDLKDDGKDPAAKSLGSRGGKARARNLSSRRKAAIAKKAAEARWRR
jgi:hypothetical protein